MFRVEVSIMMFLDMSLSKGVGLGSGNLGICLILFLDDEMGFMLYCIDNFFMEVGFIILGFLYCFFCDCLWKVL